MHQRYPLALTALLGVATLPACGSSDAQSPLTAVCVHYARHVTGGQCGAPSLPPNEVARVTPRWVKHCENVLALPGTTITVQTLDTCLTLLEAGACWSANLPEACLSMGSLPGGATCNRFGVQCQSGVCATSPTAGSPCGTCLRAVPVGQPCDPQRTASACALGSACAGSGDGGVACTPLSLGQRGASCLQDSDCEAGLNCNAALSCAPPTARGASCLKPFECAHPLVCNVNADMSQTCQAAGAAGAPCINDEFCAARLACSTSMTCGVLVWSAAGEPCDGNLARCLVGACPVGGASARPTCPAVLADGAPCAADDPTRICDVTAQCIGSRCERGTTAACP